MNGLEDLAARWGVPLSDSEHGTAAEILDRAVEAAKVPGISRQANAKAAVRQAVLDLGSDGGWFALEEIRARVLASLAPADVPKGLDRYIQKLLQGANRQGIGLRVVATRAWRLLP